MIVTIERGELAGYWTLMRSLALRLLAMMALMLMPFGMAAAPAAPAHQQQMTMAMQHCPEPGSSRHSTAALADCTMACASALPATELAAIGSYPILKFTPEPAPITALAGIELEIATPPPRLA